LSDTGVEVRRPAPGVCLVQLARPEVLNALNHDSLRALSAALSAIGPDPECRVLILAGTGRAFCSGLDLKNMGASTGSEGMPRAPRAHRNQEAFAQIVKSVVALPQPTIAAVNGAAVGAGFGLAMACDTRLASSEAYFMAPFVRIGLSGGDVGLSWTLTRSIGLARTFEILYTGRRVTASEADRIGLVGNVFEPDALADGALSLASAIASASPLATGLTKRTVWSNAGPASLEQALELENRTQTFAAMSGEFYSASAEFAGAAPDSGAGR
jgi:enoyl-CoA hydratase